MAPLLPTREEAAGLVPARGGPVWRHAADLRIVAGGGAAYALLLQVAHPVVGAGVSEHSTFRSDPWTRLLHTLDFLTATIYGGPELAHETCARVRELHRPIRGTLPGGERYHALEPGPFAWVHATLADAIVRANAHLVRPIPERELEPFWAEWRRVGRLVGVRERDLPGRWSEFGEYFDAIAADVLEPTPALADVLEALERPPPPLPGIPAALWRLARVPARRGARIGAVGLVPAGLRRRLELPWGWLEEREFRALGAAARAARPLLPGAVREFGPAYLRWRRDAVRGGVAARRSPRFRSPAAG